MAVRIGSLFVSLTAETGPLASAMGRVRSVTAQATSDIRRNVGLTERSVQNLQRTMSHRISVGRLMSASRAFEETADRANLLRSVVLSTTAIFGGFAAALSTNIVLRYADSYTKLNNQIRVVSGSSADLRARVEAIQQIADASRAGIRETGILYSRLQQAAPQENAEQVLEYVQTIQRALVLGGATAQEASSAAIQFAQAIASNRLSGDEIRAILETPLGLQLAKGIGVTIGRLREMGQEGKLTAATVLGALKNIKAGVDKQFEASTATIDQALVRLDNALTIAIGKMNEAFGITKVLSGGILLLANNVDTAVSVVSTLGLGLAAVFAGRLIGSRVGGFFGELGDSARRARTGVETLRRSLAELRDEQSAARASLGNITARQAAAPGSFASPSELAAQARAQNDIVRLNQRVADSTREQIRLGQNAIAVNADAAASAAQKAQADARYTAEVDRGNRLISERAAAQTRLAAIESTVLASSTRTATEAMVAQRAILTQTGRDINITSEALVRMQRVATPLGQTMQLLGRIGSGILGVFGGPWGLAFTGAIVALELFGASAARNAQKAANLRRIISETLKDTADGAKDNPQQRDSLLRTELKGYETDLDSAKKAAAEFAQTMKIAANSFTANTSDPKGLRSANKTIQGVRNEVVLLIDDLGRGNITQDAFLKRLDELAAQNPQIATLVGTIKGVTNEFWQSSRAAERLGQMVDEAIAKIKNLAATPVKLSFREAEDRSMDTLKAIDTTQDAIQTLKGDLREAEFRAKGLTAEARAAQLAQQARKNGKFIDEKALVPILREIDAQNKLASATKKANTEFERTAEIIDKIKREGEGAFLGDIDREVIEKAKNIQGATEKIRQYIAAVQEGNLGGAPKELTDIRSALLTTAAAESYRDIIETYGHASQLAQQFSDKQAQLNYLVESGRITAQEAAFAWADYVTKFGNYKWIDDVGNAVSQFAESAVFDFNNIADAGKNFAKALLQIGFQVLVLEPLIRGLRATLSGLFGGGGINVGSLFNGGGGFAGATGANFIPGVGFGGLYHTGGTVGVGSRRGKMLTAGQIAGAPRLHNGFGLASDEFAAVLQRGEKVIPRGRSFSGSAPVINLSSFIDAKGSNMDEAMLQRILDQRDAKLAASIVPIVKDANKRRML